MSCGADAYAHVISRTKSRQGGPADHALRIAIGLSGEFRMGQQEKRDYIAAQMESSGKDLLPDAALRGKAAMCRELSASYEPMLKGILLPVAAFFMIAALRHLYFHPSPDSGMMALSSAIAAVAFLAIGLEMRRREMTYRELEAIGFAAFGLAYLKIVSNQLIHPEPTKLFYFMLVMLVVSIFGISIRLVSAAIVLSVATMLLFAAAHDHSMLLQHLTIAMSGSITAYCMSRMIRSAITREIRARMTSDRLRKLAETRAEQDMLTNLPNRRNFFRQLRERLERVRDGGEEFVLGIVDLDGFKAINDTYGHTVGDMLLSEVANRLKLAGGGEGQVSRLGGDEFAVLIDGRRSARQLHDYGQALCDSIRAQYLISGLEFSVSASVGFVRSDMSEPDEVGLIERADFAMFRAKANGSGTVIFTPRLEEDMQQIGRIEQALRVSDKEEEMSVVFQPQVDIHSGKTTGFEALARWNSPTLGHVRPDVFIAAAERTGLIEEMTPILLNKALKFASGWPEHLKLSFNLSIRDIMSPSAIEKLCAIIENSGVDPKRLEFEVTETLIMSDFETARTSLARLQKLGSRVALDDFGVGYANFGHIDQLSINTIKIDRSFVTRLANGGQTVKLIKTMVDMCSTLGVGSIVEGVETEHELSVLRGIGARNVQGYYYSKPMAAEDIPSFLSQSLLASIGAPQVSAKQAV